MTFPMSTPRPPRRPVPPSSVCPRAGHGGARRAAPLATLCVLALLLVAPAGAQDVQIYRCTDAAGRIEIGNVPCADGQREEARTMVRPRDGAPLPASPAAPTPAPVDAGPATRVIVVRPPQPLYECVRPDGSVYDSSSAEGDPRWVPLWTLGYPSGPATGPLRGARISAPATAGISASPQAGLSIPPRMAGAGGTRDRGGPGAGRRTRPIGAYTGAGTWVRDSCSALPQTEVCARLVDRRDEVRRRFFNAQQRERDTLRVEERGINARLSQDCGVD